jgi:predicted RNA-binding protein with PIN domain
MNILVIDGDNVSARGMAKDPQKDFGSDDKRREYRERLIQLAKRHAAGKKGLEVRIYFDGGVERSAPELSSRGVKVFFTKGAEGADHAIIKFCRSHPEPRSIEVATDDHHTLTFYIRAHVGKLLSVAELMHRLDPDFTTTPALAPNRPATVEERRLSDSERSAINQTLPDHWFR